MGGGLIAVGLGLSAGETVGVAVAVTVGLATGLPTTLPAGLGVGDKAGVGVPVAIAVGAGLGLMVVVTAGLGVSVAIGLIAGANSGDGEAATVGSVWSELDSNPTAEPTTEAAIPPIIRNTLTNRSIIQPAYSLHSSTKPTQSNNCGGQVAQPSVIPV